MQGPVRVEVFGPDEFSGPVHEHRIVEHQHLGIEQVSVPGARGPLDAALDRLQLFSSALDRLS